MLRLTRSGREARSGERGQCSAPRLLAPRFHAPRSSPPAKTERLNLAGGRVDHAGRAPPSRQMLGDQVHDLLQHFVEPLVGQQDLACRFEHAQNRKLGRAFEKGSTGRIGRQEHLGCRLARMDLDRRAFSRPD